MNENGYSCSIISLSVFCIESFIARIRYIDKDNLSQKKDALHYVRNKFSKDNIFCSKISELFVLRDLIAHNHLWEVTYEFDENYNEINIKKTKFEGWGNKMFSNNTDLTTEKTKILGLDIIPTRIGKDDANKVLGVLKEFLGKINSENSVYCSKNLIEELEDILYK